MEICGSDDSVICSVKCILGKCKYCNYFSFFLLCDFILEYYSEKTEFDR